MRLMRNAENLKQDFVFFLIMTNYSQMYDNFANAKDKVKFSN